MQITYTLKFETIDDEQFLTILAEVDGDDFEIILDYDPVSELGFNYLDEQEVRGYITDQYISHQQDLWADQPTY